MMAGLLDLLQSNDPAVAQGLLQAGLSLLGSKGNFGSALSQAGFQGLNGANQYQQQNFQRQMQQSQLDDMKRKKEMQALPGQFYRAPSLPGVDAAGGMQTAMENPNNAAGPGGFDAPGYINALMGKDPMQAFQFQQLTRKDNTPMKVGKDDRLVDPQNPSRVILDALPDPAKLPPSVQEFEYARKNGFQGTIEQYEARKHQPEVTRLIAQRDALPPGDPTRKIYDNAIAKATTHQPATSVSVNTGKEGIANELKMRDDFRSEPIYKAHTEVKSAHAQIQQGLKLQSPAGDLAAATKIMKILDPGSVVRESELGMAMAASGLMDRVQNYAQNIMKGTKLTPTQRKDFQNLADALYGESVKQYNSKQGEYKDFAGAWKLNGDRVVGKPADAPISNDGWSITPK